MFGKLFKREKKKKVVVLGIDGVPCSLLRRFIDEGIMPNLAEITRKGTLSEMTASIPEVSSTSWSTFMTGVNPGRHGIYGFMELQRDTYQWRFPNSGDIKGETLWDIGGKNGKRSVVLNVPSTYPARSLNGILTAGFVALDLKKATYPESAYEYLKNAGYRMDVDTRKSQESTDALVEDIEKTFQIRKDAILHFFDKEDWDMFINVITETDRLHHYLWVALEDQDHPQHGFFIDFYRRLDSFIGELYDRAGDDTPFIILSDHGFTTIKKEIYLNVWLQEQGLLSFTKERPESMADIHGDSRVFALDPSRFYVHVKGKFQRGSVESNNYEEARQELKEKLFSLNIDGEQVIKDVLFKEDLYHGEMLDNAPDVVALSQEGFDLKGSINKTEVSGMGFLTGGHTRNNAVFFMNRQVNASNINIIDVGPTVMSLLGINGDFDGKSLL